MDYEEAMHRISNLGGGLLEIYIMGASLDDWRKVVEHMKQSCAHLRLTRSSVSVAVEIVDDMFVDDSATDVSYSLSFAIGRQTWTTAFYRVDMIDFQGDPDDVDSVESLHELADFMSSLHALTGKRVILIPETVRPLEVRPYLEIV